MIAKGTTHDNGRRLAAYMTAGKPGERAYLIQMRGFAASEISTAFRSVHILAAATQCEEPFFHVQVRNRDGETLTDTQWEAVADRIERQLGLVGQPRGLALHEDIITGDRHLHAAWSRIDDETMKAKGLPFYKLRLKQVCRDLEIELGLTPVRNHRASGSLPPTRNEMEQARRLGTDIRAVRQIIRRAWERSATGHDFSALLAENGLALAKGERRAFLVIDQNGGLHALGKRLLGVRTAIIDAKLADLHPNALRTVREIREQQPSRYRSVPTNRPPHDAGYASFERSGRGGRDGRIWHGPFHKAADHPRAGCHLSRDMPRPSQGRRFCRESTAGNSRLNPPRAPGSRESPRAGSFGGGPTRAEDRRSRTTSISNAVTHPRCKFKRVASALTKSERSHQCRGKSKRRGGDAGSGNFRRASRNLTRLRGRASGPSERHDNARGQRDPEPQEQFSAWPWWWRWDEGTVSADQTQAPLVATRQCSTMSELYRHYAYHGMLEYFFREVCPQP